MAVPEEARLFDWREASDEEVSRHFLAVQYLPPDVLQGYLAHWDQASSDARARLPGVYNISYGASERQALDLHKPEVPSGKLLLFIHGGYWRRCSKAQFTYVAERFVEAGVTVANVDYDLCPAVTVPDILLQVKSCFKFVVDHVPDWGCDPGQIYVAGHSVGAYMTAMLLGDADYAPRIAGAHLMSGIYEVLPVLRIPDLAADLRMDEDTAKRLDLSHTSPMKPVPLLVTLGKDEPDGWRDQSQLFMRLAESAGCKVQYLECAGSDHLSMIDACVSSGSEAFAAMCSLMGLPVEAQAAANK